MTIHIFKMVEDATDSIGVNYTQSEFRALADLKFKLPKRKQMVEVLAKQVRINGDINITNDFVRQIEPSACRFEIQH